ncbi:MAG: TPM domain-containing protein [Oculatellaceae cyanobacterium bins.114]|nr:TPM domain-containing protein [Oculatellaceae cyanobacterium bins.114]
MMQDVAWTRRPWFTQGWHRYRYGFVAIATTLILFMSSLNAAAWNRTQSPYPPFLDRYVNDYGQVLNANDKATIRTTLTQFANETQIQVVVLTVNSVFDYRTGDASVESFATHVFNTWGIGDRTRNDGILVLVAPSDRKVRIELGAGYDSNSDRMAQAIIDETMLPYFRQGQISQGTVAGVNAIVSRFNPAYVTSTRAPNSNTDAVNPLPFSLNNDSDGIWNIVGGCVALVSGASVIHVWRRYRQHRCPQCQNLMTRLDENADDQYLNTEEQKEESLRSVDYDVWHCQSCGHNLVKPYQNYLSGYRRCSKCDRKTLSVKTQRLCAPTYTSEGLEKVTETCQNCSYTNSFERTIARLTRNDDDHSSSSNSGGGHSSGGGASGSW